MKKSPQRRWFVAIDAPAEVRTAAATLPERFPGVPDLSWVPFGQLHLTLRFLGELDELTAATVSGGLAQVEFAPFRLVTADLGFFPDDREPQVFWLGLRHDDRLPHFKGLVDQVLAARGFPRENRRFQPHITLARMRGPLSPETLDRLCEVAAACLVGKGFLVERFVLYSSELTPDGAIHVPASSYPARNGCA